MSLAVVYRNGVFVPKEKVDLAENSEVRIIVIPSQAPKTSGSAWERHSLGLAGRMSDDFKTLGEEWGEYTK